MPNLSIPSAELVTTTRTVPLNGAPSSDDYNATNREILADLATISSILNDSILPVLHTLPENAAQGLDGRAVYAGLDANNSLFYSATAARYLTVAEVLMSLATADSNVLLKLNDLGARVIALQSKLASTSQNDILSSVQAFSDQVRQVSSQLATATQAIDGQAAQLANTRAAHVDTGSIGTNDTKTVTLNWPVPFADTNYTVTVSLEDSTGSLTMNKWWATEDGAGIKAEIFNGGSGSRHGRLHAIAKAA